MTRHTFSCTAMSTRIDTRIAKAKAAPSSAVKTVVWVMKPGADGTGGHEEHRAEQGAAGRPAFWSPPVDRWRRPRRRRCPVLSVLLVSSVMSRPSVGPEWCAGGGPRHTTVRDC